MAETTLPARNEGKGESADELRDYEERKTQLLKEIAEAVRMAEARVPAQIKAARAAKSTYTEKELAFLNRPDMHIATADEFTRYKQQLDYYFSEANEFLNDTTNLQRYPTYMSYLRRYNDIVYRALQRIKADEWFNNFYISYLNPVCDYTHKYMEDLEHRSFVNQSKLR